MGGSSSKSSSRINMSQAASMITDTIMNCKSNSVIVQELNITGDYNVVSNAKQVQAFQLSSNCIQDMKNDVEFQQKVAQAVAQSAEAQGSAVLSALGASRADQESVIQNDIKQLFQSNTMQDIVNTVNSTQGINVVGNHNIIKNFSQEQVATMVFDNVQTALNKMKSAQDMDAKLDGKASAKTTNPLSEIINSVFGGLQGLVKYWVFFAIAALLIIAFLFRNQAAALVCLFGVCDDDDKKSDTNKQSNNDANTKITKQFAEKKPSEMENNPTAEKTTTV